MRKAASKEAIRMYADGWRGAILKRGNSKDCVLYKIGHEDSFIPVADILMWDDLTDIYIRSTTWKDRHAKGIPVSMGTDQWRQCLFRLPKGDETEFCQLDISGVKYYRGAPSITFMDKGVTATFANFRYKRDWLIKRGCAIESVNDGSIPPRFYASGAY